jgi:hypothetical protein
MPELETLQVDGQPVGSWEEAYRRCHDNHQHEDDFLDDPDEPDDDEDLEEADPNQGNENHDSLNPSKGSSSIW